jgi:hypothetical protein
MATRRRFAGKRLPLTLAFGALVAAAIGAACNGFFPPNTLETIAIQPPSVNLFVTATQAFSAWGTYQDGTRSQITSGLVWTSDSPSVTINSGGTATGVSVTTSSVTITGSAQGLSGTATVTVIGDVTSITATASASTITASGTSVTFTFKGSPGPPDYITAGNGGTLTITVADSVFVCTVGTDAQGNPAESCSLGNGGSAPSYQLYMTYPSPSGGTVTSNTVTVTAINH